MMRAIIASNYLRNLLIIEVLWNLDYNISILSISTVSN